MPKELDQKISPESWEVKKIKVTIIDDDGHFLLSIKRIFSKDKYEVSGTDTPVHSIEEAMDLIKRTTPDVVILDMNLTDRYEREGLRIAEMVKQEYPATEIIINSTDWTNPELQEQFEEVGLKRGVSKIDARKLPEIIDEWEKEKEATGNEQESK